MKYYCKDHYNYINVPGERGHTPSRGAPRQYLVGGAGSPRLLPTREAEMCPPASCYESLRRNGRTRERLRREFRNVHQYTIQGAHQTPRKELTSTAKLRIDLVHLSSDPKCSNALLSSPLRLRAACVPHALHPTDEFDAPSVRKDTQPENIRVQPPQGVPTSHLANIEPAQLDACVCVRAWFKSGEVQKRQ
jgi:hypothetical protein